MAHMRWGMAAANAEMPVPDITAGFAMTESPEKFRIHGGRRFNCQMRAKAIAMANWVREKVGLPLIETPPHGHHRHAHIHGKPAFIKPVHSSSESDVATSGTVTTPSGHRVTYHQGNWSHDHPRPHHWRPASFSGRLNKALMTLGPWEGSRELLPRPQVHIAPSVNLLLVTLYVECLPIILSSLSRYSKPS